MKIIFFDGNCPMCHAWVKRILRWDRHGIFKFSPLEGEEARQTLPEILPDYIEEDTVVLYDEGKVYLRSKAALRILKVLGFPFNLLTVGYLIPVRLRDAIYQWVANHRYRYGERYDSCPVPPQKWKDRFI